MDMSQTDERLSPTLREIRETLAKDFGDAWLLNDAAHRQRHFDEVEDVGHYLNRTLRMGFDPKLITLSAYFHDLFAWSRFNHHKLSAEWVRTTDYHLIKALTPEDRELVAQGCQHHRASGVGGWPSKFAELICAADRGFPCEVRALVIRCITGNIVKMAGSTNLEILQHVTQHIKDKYGSNGYARFPDCYQWAFSQQLDKQRLIVDSMVIVGDQLHIADEPFTHPFQQNQAH